MRHCCSFFFSSRRRHTRCSRDWSSDVCSSDLEEINMVEDAPDDQVFDLSYQALWPNHPYGYSILGTRDTVSTLSADDLKQLHGRAYFPGNCVIAAAGNLGHEGLLDELGKMAWFDGDRGRETMDGYDAAAGAPGVWGLGGRDGEEE